MKTKNRWLYRLFTCFLTILFLSAPQVSRQAFATDPLDTWYSRSYSPPEFTVNSVATDNEIFVAVGLGGTILTSIDGNTWTNQSSGTTTSLYGITYGNDIFVAVGANGTILTSEFGDSWFRQTSGTSVILRSIIFGDGRFVAVGDSGTILTSTDGVAWLVRSSTDVQSFGATNGNLYGVTYGNGTFMTVGSSFNGLNSRGSIFTSTDGTTWTTSLFNQILYRLNSVAFGNGTFAVVGYLAGDLTAHAMILTSTDGSIWTSPTYQLLNWIPLNDITYANETFVAVGGQGEILTSSDASNWTTRPLAATNNLNGVTFAKGTFVAVADGGKIFQSNAMLPQLSISPGTISFNSVNIGSSSAPQVVTISNKGYSDLIVSPLTLSGTDADQFRLTIGTCPSLAPTLPSGSNCTLNLHFSPVNLGSKNATLQITSNDTVSPNTLTLSGTGTTPRYPLTLSVTGPGTVRSYTTPPTQDINCSGNCSQSYDAGTVITLFPSAVAVWSGCDNLINREACSLTMNSMKTVTAYFSEIPTCTNNYQCGAGFYCSKPTGNCGGTGTCAAWNPGRICTQDWLPLCGCDGRTYGNSCEAFNAGVSIAYSGACGVNNCYSSYQTALDDGAICWGIHSSNEILYANLHKTVVIGGGAILKGIVISDGTVEVNGVTLQ